MLSNISKTFPLVLVFAIMFTVLSFAQAGFLCKNYGYENTQNGNDE